MRNKVVVVCSRLLAQLDETENAFEQFWCKHHLKLEQCLQLRHFEQDFREVRLNTQPPDPPPCASSHALQMSNRKKKKKKTPHALEEKVWNLALTITPFLGLFSYCNMVKVGPVLSISNFGPRAISNDY